MLNNLNFRYNYLFPFYAHLPSRLAYAMTTRQARYLSRYKQREADLIRTQMQMVLQQASDTELDQYLQDYFAMVEAEVLDSFILHKSPKIVTLKGFDQVIDARNAGQKIILTGGHFGRFWMAGPAMHAAGQTVGTITRDGHADNPHGLPDAEHQFRMRKLARLQQALGGPFLLEGQQSRELYTALQDHLITLIFDVPYTHDHAGSVIVPFLGSTIKIPAGVYRIARKTDALVVPFFMQNRGNGQLVADFESPLSTNHYDAGTFMGLLAERLEKRIYQTPGNWWLWEALPMLRADS
jgi:lauroyl/myristoyl acyltransferase